jgi:hypothetical protein
MRDSAADDWSALAEIIGNAAAIVTLAILAAQIRGNTKAVRYQFNLERYRAVYTPDLSDSAIAIQAKIAQVDGVPPTAAILVTNPRMRKPCANLDSTATSSEFSNRSSSRSAPASNCHARYGSS